MNILVNVLVNTLVNAPKSNVVLSTLAASLAYKCKSVQKRRFSARREMSGIPGIE